MAISYNISDSWIIRFEKQSGIIKDTATSQLERVRQKMMQGLNISMSQSACQNLQNVLNKLITSDGFEQVSEELLSQITEGKIDIDTEIKGTGGLQLANKKWKEYFRYRDELLRSGQSIENDSMLNKYLSAALGEQGKLSGIKGQMFESVIKAISEVGSSTATSISDITVDQLLSHIKSSSFSYKTEGAQRTSINTDVDLGGGMSYSIRSASQNKVDVSLSFTTDQGEEYKNIGVSAKNYSALRDIHILSEASVMGLISQWLGASAALNKSMLNIMSSRDNPNYSTILDKVKRIFAIQALAGQKQQEQKADILIVNTNIGKNPIRVVSISTLLAQALEPDIEEKFIFMFNGSVRVPRTPPKEALAETFAQTITIQLKKNALTLSYLSGLS